MNRALLILFIAITGFSGLHAQVITFNDNQLKDGYNLVSARGAGLEINFGVSKFTLQDVAVKNETLKAVLLNDHFLPGEEGMPDLPGSGRYIAVPQGARPVLHIKSLRKEIIENVSVAPAPKIPTDREKGSLVYEKNDKVYTTNTFYPAEPVKLSEITQIRGVDAVILGITPFQYNPVTKELVVLREIEVEIEFDGGNSQFGDPRLQSRWWEPLLADLFMNYEQIAAIPSPEWGRVREGVDATGAEYVIICPDGPEFQAWADTIKRFRNEQGILTEVFPISEVGGNNATVIENFINDAYANWDIPPAACLMLGDYGSNSQSALVSNILNDHPDGYNPYISDNPFSDVNDDMLPDVIFSRITARDEAELSLMVNKFLDYERNPPTSEYFYDHPITALGWQTERWFQICSEAVGGYFRNVQGKDPVRINEIYDGNPTVDPWSTASNTQMILDVFGPDGLGYLPEAPGDLGNWSGGNAADINTAVNSGAFLLQHRDHGYDLGWGEPDYSTADIPGLANTDLTFVMSINCQTGKFNGSQECFAEKFHRHKTGNHASGALGVIAPTEVSYSFVNDVFVWGMYDNIFPDFLPDFGSTPESRGVLPAFGCAAGKYFLNYSNWPAYPSLKPITFNLFHAHSDAFTTIYTEVPQQLSIQHEQAQMAGNNVFHILADEGALVALSVDGELIGVATGTGEYMDIPIVAQLPPVFIKVVATKQNHFRYEGYAQVIPPDGPFVITDSYIVDDAAGNSDGKLDYGETVALDMNFKNLGTETAENVMVSISSNDPFVTIGDDSVEAGNISAGETLQVAGAFSVTASGDIPNGHVIMINMQAGDNDTVWNSTFSIKAHAPVLEYEEYTISDPDGNNNGRLDPGETAELTLSVRNKGTSAAYNVYGILACSDPFIEVISDSVMFGNIPENEIIQQSFQVSAALVTPPGHQADFTVNFTGNLGITASQEFSTFVGLFPILILDFDPNHNSASKIHDAIDDWRVFAEYTTTLPDDLSQYQTIFLSLGTYSDNFVLSDAEAEPLMQFLENGGNLYMEGADTWYYDQLYDPTGLQPMFNINGISDGSDDLGTIAGVNGTFTEGLSFYFNGDNNYIDHIAPVAPAVSILSNTNPAYDVAVAYDAGTYKTIGSSFEFGGLTDMQSSTKKNLMQRYLDFFGMDPISEIPVTPVGDTLVCSGTTSCIYTTAPVIGALYYIWELNPPLAGDIEGWDTAVTVNWTSGYIGDATLRVCGMNHNGLGPVSTSLLIHRAQAPNAVLSFTTNEICAGDTTWATINLSGTMPWSLMVSIGGNELPLYSNKPNMEGIPFNPTADVEVTVVSVTDGSGCTTTGFSPVLVTVLPLPSTPAKATGPEYIDLYAGSQTVFSTTGSADALSYEWTIEPVEAGTMAVSESGLDCTIDWAAAFTGTATLKIKAMNDCGESDLSEPLAVTVANTFGIEDPGSGTGVSIIPNPSSGSFQLSVRDMEDVLSIRIVNTAGEIIYKEDDIKVHGVLNKMIDLSGNSVGIYYLHLEGQGSLISRKIVVQR